jgi:hypothetical protein
MTWGVGSYNTNPDLNGSINGHDISEGSPAGGYDDALRQIMADIAGWVATGLSTLGGLAVGFRDLQPITKTGAFTFADAERGQGLRFTGTAASGTINPNATTPITLGAVYVIRNAGTGVLTIAPGGGVSLFKNGATSSSSAAIAVGGIATLTNWATDDWVIVGTGVS